jgi:molybdopterin molybdotransferase
MKSLEAIAAEIQGYDPQALRADAVGAFLARLVEPLRETETVLLPDALDRILAHDIISPINVPPHDNSAMDGYAFDGAALQTGAPLVLRVVGTALAGKAWQGTVAKGECVRIMTGAIMPAGLDTVVPQEFTRSEGDLVTVPAGVVQRGDNRRLLGEDLMAGRAALHRGTRLGPAACGLLASLGQRSVSVIRRPRVAYFSTGDEILSLGEAPREGAVYDSNRYTVLGLLRRLGCQPLDLGHVRDDPAALEARFREAAREADAIITSGGVSVGEADFTKAMMRQLGDVAFWRIAMRPGRPMAVGRLSAEKTTLPQRQLVDSRYQKVNRDPPGALLFGLPGNPVAVMVTFLAFVRPALLRLMGCTDAPPPLLQARSLEALRKKPGRTEYQRGIVSRSADGTLSVRTTGNQGSGVLRSMVEANGLIVLHHDQGSVGVGDPVDVMMFDGVI